MVAQGRLADDKIMSGGEIILILAVALLLFGPKNLPEMARKWGRMMEQFRRAARDVQDEIMRGPEPSRPAKPPELPASSAPMDEDGVSQAGDGDWMPPEAVNGDAPDMPSDADAPPPPAPPPEPGAPQEDFKAHGDGI